jgi:hypothetical protein
VLSAVTKFVGGILVENDEGTFSIGRLALLTLHAAIVYTFVSQPQIITALSWEAVTLILSVYVILSVYNFGKKPWVREVLFKVIDRFPVTSPREDP